MQGRCRSDVVVEGELPGMGPRLHREHLVLHLVGDPCLDHVLGEHVSLEQEVVVLLEGLEGLTK